MSVRSRATDEELLAQLPLKPLPRRQVGRLGTVASHVDP